MQPSRAGRGSPDSPSPQSRGVGRAVLAGISDRSRTGGLRLIQKSGITDGTGPARRRPEIKKAYSHMRGQRGSRLEHSMQKIHIDQAPVNHSRRLTCSSLLPLTAAEEVSR